MSLYNEIQERMKAQTSDPPQEKPAHKKRAWKIEKVYESPDVRVILSSSGLSFSISIGAPSIDQNETRRFIAVKDQYEKPLHEQISQFVHDALVDAVVLKDQLKKRIEAKKAAQESRKPRPTGLSALAKQDAEKKGQQFVSKSEKKHLQKQQGKKEQT